MYITILTTNLSKTFAEAVPSKVAQLIRMSYVCGDDGGIDIVLQVHLDRTLENIVNFNDGHTIKSHSCRLQQMVNWLFIYFFNELHTIFYPYLKKVNH